jgi:hypothetical protein
MLTLLLLYNLSTTGAVLSLFPVVHVILPPALYYRCSGVYSYQQCCIIAFYAGSLFLLALAFDSDFENLNITIKTSTLDYNVERCLSSIVNSFQAIVPYMGQEKGVLFYGGVSPSKIAHVGRALKVM